MYRQLPLKDHQGEIQLVTHRAIISLIIMIVLILLLILRLAYLQLSQHDLYTTLSKKNWLDLVPVEPTRGLIFDRNGVLLAENVPVFSLDIIPNKIENMPQTLSEIAKIIPLTDTDIAQFQKQLKQHRRFDEIPLKLRLTEEEVAKFSEYQYRFPGAIIKGRLMRRYPFGGSFIHVLGYVGRINLQELNEIDASNYSASNYIGKLGIEKYYEDELHGSVGYEHVENDARGEPLRVLSQIKPVPGENIYLTIDSKLQLAAEEALAGNKGAVVAIQPSTGQILAMVSEPTYDPNQFVAGVSSEEFKLLQQAPDRPLYNRALRGLYPFGSTIKPFLAVQALNSNVVDPYFTIYDMGTFQLKNSSQVFHDWRRRGHGKVNISKAITVSCDTFFYELANKLGIDRIDKILTDFGFGQLSGIDLGEELPGNVATPAWKRRVKGVSWYPGDTINAGIGQGFMQTTPLQLAVGVATIANRGKRFTPYLLLSEQEMGKPLTKATSNPFETISINDPKYWDIVINAMVGVISSPEGTGFGRWGGTKDLPYTVAAKTGTAQVVRKKNYDKDHENQDDLPEAFRDHSLFMAFAPADKPKIAVAVIMENSLQAITVARKVLDYYLIGPPPTPKPVSTPRPTASTNTGDNSFGTN